MFLAAIRAFGKGTPVLLAILSQRSTFSLSWDSRRLGGSRVGQLKLGHEVLCLSQVVRVLEPCGGSLDPTLDL